MYDRFAEFYEHWHDPGWYEQRLPFILKAAGLDKKDRVYEGGCGTGHLTKELAQAGIRVLATDVSAAMLRIARKKLDHPEVLFLHEDLRSLPVRQGFQAFLFCLDVVQYLEPDDLLRLFRTVFSSLPEGGVLLFDHLPERTLRRQASGPPIVYRSRDRKMVWHTRITGKIATYSLQLAHNERCMNEIQKLWVYKKREIGNLLLRSGDWDIRVFGDYAMIPARASSERFVWIAKKRHSG